MRYRLNDLHNKSGAELAQAFAGIPAGVTTLDLSWNDLHNKSGAELAQVFAGIPAGVTTLDLSWNDLHNKSGAELAQAFAAIPAGVTTLDLSGNDLHNKSGAELAQAFAAAPAGVTTLDLSGNDLHNKSGAELAQAFAAAPAGVTTLELSRNGLHNKSGAELAQAFAAIPAGVTTLGLNRNGLCNKSKTELTQAFAGIPAGTTLDLGGNGGLVQGFIFDTLTGRASIAVPKKVKLRTNGSKVQNKSDINFLLNSYLKKRTAVTDSTGRTKEYFYGSFFSVFQKSFKQKKDAVNALKSALDGDNVDLSAHLSTLRNGNLGKELQAFIKSCEGFGLVDKKVTTVTEFVQALQEKVSNQAQLH